MPVFYQYIVNPTCQFCSDAPETRHHFIAESCVFFKAEKNIYIIKAIVYLSPSRNADCKDRSTQLTLHVSLVPNVIPEQTLLDTLELS